MCRVGGALVPLRQCLSDTYDAPSQPDQYLAILVIAQSLEDAAGTGPKPTIEERVDAIEFVRGDWRLALWCDAARIMPELVQQAAVIVEPPPERLKFGVKLDRDKVREIRAQWAAGVQQVVLAARYGVRPEAIGRIVRGKAWREVTG
jgi:hypothetical protein